jgi:hypothetical protein
MKEEYNTAKNRGCREKNSLIRKLILLSLFSCISILASSQRNIIHLGISQQNKDSVLHVPTIRIEGAVQENHHGEMDTVELGKTLGFGDYLFFYLFTPRYYLQVNQYFTKLKHQ